MIGKVSVRRAASVLIGIVILTLSACSVWEDTAIYNSRMFEAAIGPAINEWKAKHAEVLGVSIANINTRWDQGNGQLDTQPAKDYWFDLSTDFCSSGPDTGMAFDFKASCVRHDFGWRNLKKLDRHWNCPQAAMNKPCGYEGRPVGTLGHFDSRSNRLSANTVFKNDMYDHCASRSIFLKPDCYTTANLYYNIVNLAA